MSDTVDMKSVEKHTSSGDRELLRRIARADGPITDEALAEQEERPVFELWDTHFRKFLTYDLVSLGQEGVNATFEPTERCRRLLD